MCTCLDKIPSATHLKYTVTCMWIWAEKRRGSAVEEMAAFDLGPAHTHGWVPDPTLATRTRTSTSAAMSARRAALGSIGALGLRITPSPISRAIAAPYVPVQRLAQVRHSHIGRLPIHVPVGVTFKIVDLPPPLLPPGGILESNGVVAPTSVPPVALALKAYETAGVTRKDLPDLLSLPADMRTARSIVVSGPVGECVVPLYECVGLNIAPPIAAKSSEDENQSGVVITRVTEVEKRKNHALWGLTRQLISNAVKGVSECHSAVINLVGVGYRAMLEPDPFAAEQYQQRLANYKLETEGIPAAIAAMARKNPNVLHILPYHNRKEIMGHRERNGTRLNLRLGFSHPVLIPVPKGVVATMPSQTRIILKSTTKDLLGEFSATVRRWRPPEPYKVCHIPTSETLPLTVLLSRAKVSLSTTRQSGSRLPRRSSRLDFPLAHCIRITGTACVHDRQD